MRGMSRAFSKAVFAFCKAALAQTHFQRFKKKIIYDDAMKNYGVNLKKPAKNTMALI